MNNAAAGGIVWEEGDKNDTLLSHFLTTSIFYLVLLNPLIDLVSGFLSSVLHFPAFGLVLRAMVIMFSGLLVLVIPIRKSIPFMWFVMITFALVMLRMIRIDVTVGKVAYDIHYLGRGYLFFLAISMFIYMLSVPSSLSLFKRYFIFTWVLVTVMVGLHFLTGYGQPTYKTGEGYISYFDSGNQLTFVYTSAWWVIVSLLLRRWWLRLIFTFMTLAILLAIGTKTGFVLIIGMTGLFALYWTKRKSIWLFAGTVLLSVGLMVVAVLNLRTILLAIIDFYVNYSSVAEKFTRNAGVDPLTIVSSQRDVMVGYAAQIIGRFNFKDIIIGIGVGNYAQQLAIISRVPGLTEVDTVDLLAGWGIVGLVFFYSPFVFLFVRLARRWSYAVAKAEKWGYKRMPYVVQGLITMYVVASSGSGHIAFAPSPMIGMAVMMIFAWKLSEKEG